MSSLKVVQFLDAIAQMNEQLVALEQGFWMLPGVARVSRSLDIRRYDYGLVLDAYVDVGTVDGNNMAWLLDVVWDEGRWTISSRVTTNGGEHEEVLARHPDVEATSVEQLIVELERRTALIVESARSANWAG